jgi:hypothetical protein
VAAAAAWAILVTAEVFLDDVAEGAEAGAQFDDGPHHSLEHDDSADPLHFDHDSDANLDRYSPHRSTLHPTDDIPAGHDGDYDSTHDPSHDAGHDAGSDALQETGHDALTGDAGGHPGLTSGSNDYSLGHEVLAVDATYGYAAAAYLPGDAIHDGYGYAYDSGGDSGDHAHDGGLDLAGPDGDAQA